MGVSGVVWCGIRDVCVHVRFGCCVRVVVVV